MRNQCILLFGLLAGLGCTPSQQDDPAAVGRNPVDKDKVHFDLARIYLPHGAGRENPAHLLAPIIVHESPGTAAWLSPAGGRPRVLLVRSEIKIKELDYAQFIYSWEHSGNSPGAPASPSKRILRMTLDSRGHPTIYELFSEEGHLETLHVSLSLEQAAAREHGPALAGRSFSIEATGGPGLSGIVKEGPVAMGPLVYFDSPGRKNVALTCRCSPSRITRADGNHRYELVETDPDLQATANRLPTSLQTLENLRLPSEF